MYWPNKNMKINSQKSINNLVIKINKKRSRKCPICPTQTLSINTTFSSELLIPHQNTPSLTSSTYTHNICQHHLHITRVVRVIFSIPDLLHLTVMSWMAQWSFNLLKTDLLQGKDLSSWSMNWNQSRCKNQKKDIILSSTTESEPLRLHLFSKAKKDFSKRFQLFMNRRNSNTWRGWNECQTMWR